jgi:hypothetical protein
MEAGHERVARRRRSGLAPAATVVAWSRAVEGYRQRRSVPTRGCRVLTPWCRAGLEAKKKWSIAVGLLGCWCYKRCTGCSAAGYHVCTHTRLAPSPLPLFD